MHLHKTATRMLSEEEINWTSGQGKTKRNKRGRVFSFQFWIRSPEAVNCPECFVNRREAWRRGIIAVERGRLSRSRPGSVGL